MGVAGGLKFIKGQPCVWGNWFIATFVTLVTHSLGVNSSGVSRGIHHKCEHPLNPTRLYVAGWVESSLSVLIWRVVTWLDDMCIIDCGSISVCMTKPLLALAYPFVFVVCPAVWYSLLRWALTCWCEQMRGTPVGNREVMVPLHSMHGLVFSFFIGLFFRAKAHVLVCPWIYILSL